MRKLLVILALFMLSPAILAAGQIIVSPASSSGIPGGTVSVNIAANAVTNMYGYQFDLDYNPSVLSFDSITFSSAVLGSLSSPQQQFCTDEADWEISSGHIGNVACTRTVSGEINPATGTLATITFDILASGSSSLILGNVIVANSVPTSVSVTTSNGSFTTCSSVACTVNEDCDDSNPLTTDICLNPGTCVASCSNPLVPACEEGTIESQCACEGSVYSSGLCCGDTYQPSVACTAAADCDDGDSCTTDSCYDGGGEVCAVACVNTPIIGCGGPTCGNSVCEVGEDDNNCPEDCAPTPVCGNDVCETGEDENNCPTDCDVGAVCGDDVCALGESCTSCSTDCGTCPPVAVCGDGSCNGSESCSSCSTDCGACGTPGSGPGDGGTGGTGGGGDTGGGAGGGGGGTGSEGYKAATREFSLAPLEMGEPATATVKVSHGFPKQSAFMVQVHVLKGNQLVFYTEEETGLIEGGRTLNVEFDSSWIPKEGGEYDVIVVLSTADKKLNYDIQQFKYSIAGAPESDGTNIADDLVNQVNRVINPNQSNRPDININDLEEVEPARPLNTTELALVGLATIVIIGIIFFIKMRG